MSLQGGYREPLKVFRHKNQAFDIYKSRSGGGPTGGVLLFSVLFFFVIASFFF